MDATIGFININQNRRVSQLTFFGVVFMSLKILAGVGGMSECSMMTQGMADRIRCIHRRHGPVGMDQFVVLKHFENRRVKGVRKDAPVARP